MKLSIPQLDAQATVSNALLTTNARHVMQDSYLVATNYVYSNALSDNTITVHSEHVQVAHLDAVVVIPMAYAHHV